MTEGSAFASSTEETTIFLVKKPASNSSREIRDSILIAEFGFTAKEIEALVAEKDKLFYVRQDNEKDWATVGQVSKWTTNAEGELAIPVRRKVIEDILAFHQRYLETRIFEAVLGITDPTLRANVYKDLLTILNSPSGSDRIASLYDLLNDTRGNLQAATEISSAVSRLIKEAGQEDNPFLTLIQANAAMTEYTMRSGPGYDIAAITLINEAVRETTSKYLFGKSSSRVAMSRTEAAMLNRQLATMYSQMGKESESRERDWSARFYDISDEERRTLEEGDVIELTSPVEAMGTPPPLTQAHRELDRLDDRHEQRVIMQQQIDKIGSQVVPTDHRTSQYFQRSDDPYEYNSFERKKNRGPKIGYQPKYKVVTKTMNPYARANVQADGFGAALELPIKAAKYANTLRRLDEITDYLNRRKVLLARIRGESRYLVPLKPEKVEALIKQVQRYGRVVSNPTAKVQARITLAQLERMWEDSNAFWDKRK